MIYFEDKYVLLFLVSLVPLIYLFYGSYKEYSRFVNSKTFVNYKYDSCIPSKTTRVIAVSIFLIAFSFLIAGIAEPCIKLQSRDTLYKNVRLFFVLDVSGSMHMAEDIKPNRLEAAKNEIKDAVQNIDGRYVMYLVPFSSHANTMYCANTSSKKTFLTMLNDVDHNVVYGSGTNLMDALSGVDRLAKKYKVEDGVNIVILLTDGGKEDEISIDKDGINSIIKSLGKYGFKFYTVGVGTKKPTPLIVRDKKGNAQNYVESNGAICYSELDEGILLDIAKTGGGSYYRFEQYGGLAGQINKIIYKNRQIDKQDIQYEKINIRFLFFCIAATLFWVQYNLNFTYRNIFEN